MSVGVWCIILQNEVPLQMLSTKSVRPRPNNSWLWRGWRFEQDGADVWTNQDNTRWLEVRGCETRHTGVWGLQQKETTVDMRTSQCQWKAEFFTFNCWDITFYTTIIFWHYSEYSELTGLCDNHILLKQQLIQNSIIICVCVMWQKNPHILPFPTVIMM